MIRLSSICALALVTLATACSFSVAMAQDDDLTVPGLTDTDSTSGNTATPFTGAAVDEENRQVESSTSVLSLIAKGGAAMWLLGLFSLALIGLGVYCFIDFKADNFYPEGTEAFLREKISNANLESVITSSKEPGNNTLTAMCANVSDYIHENGYTADDGELHRNLISEAGQKHNRQRARLVNYFTVIAQAAPMAGLLGTVFGMIKAFSTLGSGVNNPNVLAENISEALVTTASGLIIALPAIFLYFYFRDHLEELVSNSEDRANKMLPLLRQAAFAAELAEDEAMANRRNVYNDADDIQYDS